MYIDVSTFTNYKEVKELEKLGQKLIRNEITKEEFFKVAADLGYDVEKIKEGFESRKR